MNPQVQKTINLIKATYDQPIIFHILHCNLVLLLTNTTPTLEISDDWSKILVYSAHPNKIPNQGLELKIQDFLKKMRPPFDTSEKKLKLMVICYYLLNRPASLINHILVFELVSNFLGYSEYFDGLILKMLSNIVISRLYNIEQNKKIKDSVVQRMVELVQTKSLSDENKIKALPCFIDSDTKPFNASLAVIDQSFIGYKYLEIFCFYAKYSKNATYIREILPNNISFIDGLKDFMAFNFSFSVTNDIDLKKCFVEDKSIFDQIKQAFGLTEDKSKFISDLLEYISNLG
ncbi:uncharacterized protein VICG_00128 [Vittaforma corneae ATCC 50505]|uniref:Uncharacterized protein n=1 Tax=Vittaforma corneae (strain ATCC 50505) TaxID=993615 RepID=L2GPJ4_VITCO|nr:uncharacterized protein VICG_00128 [Vittaforma corneae ATCC 50505]ELA42813.1 hypothetical protein VICG_00128 [Vittaforma corneae ATCC 50505]